MIMEYVSGGELFDYIVKHGKVYLKIKVFQCSRYTFCARGEPPFPFTIVRCKLESFSLEPIHDYPAADHPVKSVVDVVFGNT